MLVHHDASLLAKAAAARLVTRLVDAQASSGSAHLVLTGGGIGTAVLAELAAAPALDAVDWRRLDIWWGDDRFLPSGDLERNEAQAQQALLSYVDADPARVHRMPGTDGPDGSDPEAAAARYAAELRRAAQPQDHGPVPAFDVLLLGSRAGGARRLALPRHAGAVRRAAGRRCPRGTQAAAHEDHHDAARYPAGP